MKYYMIVLVMSVTALFYFCTKRPSGSMLDFPYRDTSSVIDTKNNRMATGADGLTCNCTSSQAFCRAECIFSECCLCWNPTVETGACACYFGIAKCKTSLIGRDAPSVADHRVRFYPKRFEQMLQYLRQESIPVDSMEAAYRSLLHSSYDSQGTGSTVADKMEVSGSAYDLFYSAYQRTITGYKEGDQQRILAFVQAFKKNPSSK